MAARHLVLHASVFDAKTDIGGECSGALKQSLGNLNRTVVGCSSDAGAQKDEQPGVFRSAVPS